MQGRETQAEYQDPPPPYHPKIIENQPKSFENQHAAGLPPIPDSLPRRPVSSHKQPLPTDVSPGLTPHPSRGQLKARASTEPIRPSHETPPLSPRPDLPQKQSLLPVEPRQLSSTSSNATSPDTPDNETTSRRLLDEFPAPPTSRPQAPPNQPLTAEVEMISSPLHSSPTSPNSRPPPSQRLSVEAEAPSRSFPEAHFIQPDAALPSGQPHTAENENSPVPFSREPLAPPPSRPSSRLPASHPSAANSVGTSGPSPDVLPITLPQSPPSPQSTIDAKIATSSSRASSTPPGSRLPSNQTSTVEAEKILRSSEEVPSTSSIPDAPSGTSPGGNIRASDGTKSEAPAVAPRTEASPSLKTHSDTGSFSGTLAAANTPPPHPSQDLSRATTTASPKPCSLAEPSSTAIPSSSTPAASSSNLPLVFGASQASLPPPRPVAETTATNFPEYTGGNEPPNSIKSNQTAKEKERLSRAPTPHNSQPRGGDQESSPPSPGTGSQGDNSPGSNRAGHSELTTPSERPPDDPNNGPRLPPDRLDQPRLPGDNKGQRVTASPARNATRPVASEKKSSSRLGWLCSCFSRKKQLSQLDW